MSIPLNQKWLQRSLTTTNSYYCQRDTASGRSNYTVPSPFASFSTFQQVFFSIGRLSPRSYSTSATSHSSYPPHTLLQLPALSPTMTSGSIQEWVTTEGSSFQPGDVLCSIETDKAAVDFEAQDEGILAKILVQPGKEMAVGQPIGVVVEEASDVESFKDFAAPETVATSSPTEGSVDPKAPTAAASSPATAFLMPSARHLAESKGLDATGLVGSGKGCRITKGDVQAAIRSGTLPKLTTTSVAATLASVPTVAATSSTAPVDTSTSSSVTVPAVDTHGTFEDVPNSKMRKVIASRLTESKRSVPHSYSTVEISIDNVLKLRKEWKKADIKVSVNDIVIKCSAMALRDVPEVNGTVVSDSYYRLNPSIDVSVAVATPTGLITPIVQQADTLGLVQLSNTVKDLARRARDGKLAPHEYQGGTFSVSNLGMFGITEFSAVINPPQTAILAVGGGNRQLIPSVYDPSKEVQDPPFIQTTMVGCLSSDRRVVDEATAALFMEALKEYMSRPELLLL